MEFAHAFNNPSLKNNSNKIKLLGSELTFFWTAIHGHMFCERIETTSSLSTGLIRVFSPAPALFFLKLIALASELILLWTRLLCGHVLKENRNFMYNL